MSRALRIAHGDFGRVALLDMDRSLVRHAHPHCHVLLKLGGDDTRFAVGSSLAPLTDDLAVLVNAWEPHAYVHDPSRRNALILALYIAPSWLRLVQADRIAPGAPGFFPASAGRIDAGIRRLAHDLADAMVDPAMQAAAREAASALLSHSGTALDVISDPSPDRILTILTLSCLMTRERIFASLNHKQESGYADSSPAMPETPDYACYDSSPRRVQIPRDSRSWYPSRLLANYRYCLGSERHL